MMYKVEQPRVGYISKEELDKSYIKCCENTYHDMFCKSYTNFNYDEIYIKYYVHIVFENMRKEILEKRCENAKNKIHK